MTLHTFKRQLKAYLFHFWCIDKQKEHLPPPGAVVPTYLLTYLLTYIVLGLGKVTIKSLCFLYSVSFRKTPVWGQDTPLSPLSVYCLIFSPFYFSLSFIGFTYFLLLSIPSLSTRIVPLRFQAGGRRKRRNLGLVCCVICVICIP